MGIIETDLQILVARIEKLESQNLRWRAASVVVALFASSILLMAAKPADRIETPILRVTTVEAREIILKNRDGHVCARLSVTPIISRGNNHATFESEGQDLAVLEIYDERGNPVWVAPPSPTLVPAIYGSIHRIP